MDRFKSVNPGSNQDRNEASRGDQGSHKGSDFVQMLMDYGQKSNVQTMEQLMSGFVSSLAQKDREEAVSQILGGMTSTKEDFAKLLGGYINSQNNAVMERLLTAALPQAQAPIDMQNATGAAKVIEALLNAKATAQPAPSNPMANLIGGLLNSQTIPQKDPAQQLIETLNNQMNPNSVGAANLIAGLLAAKSQQNSGQDATPFAQLIGGLLNQNTQADNSNARGAAGLIGGLLAAKSQPAGPDPQMAQLIGGLLNQNTPQQGPSKEAIGATGLIGGLLAGTQAKADPSIEQLIGELAAAQKLPTKNDGNDVAQLIGGLLEANSRFNLCLEKKPIDEGITNLLASQVLRAQKNTDEGSSLLHLREA